MNTSEGGINFIKGWEDFVSQVYPDAAGKPTIGYGHLIKTGEKFTAISEAEAETLLRSDLQAAESAVNDLITATLNQNQYDALVSFVFNLGRRNFTTSQLRKQANYGDTISAAQEFPKWIYAGGGKSLGLARRRFAEAVLYLS